MTSSISRRQMMAALAAVSAAAMLAACSDSDQPAAETPPATTTETPPAMKPETPPAASAEVKAPEAQGKVDVAKLMEAGPLSEQALGKADAPVTIVEYASMTCPHCAQFHASTLPELKTNYIDTGKVRLVFREFPFDPRAEAGFMLARCADSNYFPMIDVLFKQQESWAGGENAKDALLQISKLAGFSQQKFEECLTNQKLLDDIRAVRTKGQGEFKVDSTPTFFINGNQYKGALSVAEISAIIDPML